MELYEKINISILLDYYGDLLSKNQYNMLMLRFNKDLSLAEIADTKNITRQGVRDAINRGVKALYEYEDKLKLKYKSNKLIKKLYHITENVNNKQYDDALILLKETINGLEDN